MRVDWSATRKARAFRAAWLPSATASAVYVLPDTSAAPVQFNPPAGRYPTQRSVVLTSATPGAVIHYTTDGSEPTSGSPSVASGGSVLVDRDLVLTAGAWASGVAPSPRRRAEYRVTGMVSAGFDHVAVLKSDGSVWTWGGNASGQLGVGSQVTSYTPAPVPGLSNVVWITSSAGLSSVAGAYSLAVKADGTVWGFGDNTWGQLGNGTQSNLSLSPTQVSTSSGLSGVVAVAAGGQHALALTSSGGVWSWGANNYGQLGDGTNSPRLTPVPVPGLTDVMAVAAGEGHSLALKRDGTVWVFGRADWGQIGTGGGAPSLTPIQVTTMRGIRSLAAGPHHSLAVADDGLGYGSVWGFGQSGADGLLGDASLDNRLVPVRTLDGVERVAAGLRATLFLARDPGGGTSVWGVGQHRAGALDLANWLPMNSSTPVRIVRGDFVDLAVSLGVSVLTRADGTLLVWWGVSNNAGSGFQVAPAGSGGLDPDGDGLTTAQEWRLGSDPWDADTNDDGVPDGLAVSSGLSATNIDMDGDGVPNASEREQGMNPFAVDSDGDGSPDGVDCFPLDVTRWQCLVPTPGDVTPPGVTLEEPTNAVLVSSTP